MNEKDLILNKVTLIKNEKNVQFKKDPLFI